MHWQTFYSLLHPWSWHHARIRFSTFSIRCEVSLVSSRRSAEQIVGEYIEILVCFCLFHFWSEFARWNHHMQPEKQQWTKGRTFAHTPWSLSDLSSVQFESFAASTSHDCTQFVFCWASNFKVCTFLFNSFLGGLHCDCSKCNDRKNTSAALTFTEAEQTCKDCEIGQDSVVHQSPLKFLYGNYGRAGRAT